MSDAYKNSGHKGVHWDSIRCRWFSKIHINGRSLFLGRFREKSNAIEAREISETAFSLLQDMGAKDIHISDLEIESHIKILCGSISKDGAIFSIQIQFDDKKSNVGDDL